MLPKSVVSVGSMAVLPMVIARLPHLAQCCIIYGYGDNTERNEGVWRCTTLDPVHNRFVHGQTACPCSYDKHKKEPLAQQLQVAVVVANRHVAVCKLLVVVVELAQQLRVVLGLAQQLWMMVDRLVTVLEREAQQKPLK